MARMTLGVLAALCACAYAFPEEPTGPITRNTIFADEKFEGAIFENMDSIEELSRNSLNASAFRLPTTTKPTHYDVIWQINMNSLAMSGSVQITLYATQTGVNEIVLHAAQLTIPTAGVYLSQGSTNVPVTFTLEPETGFMRVRLREGYLTYNANPVLYKLDISFNAPLRTDMYGIYQSWYRNNPSNLNEPIKWIASTQFQATSARFAFPCYDEPSFKATFDIIIRRPIGFKSWSCTKQDITRTSLFPGYQEDVYTRTPMMSTYLLALIVAEYDSKTFPQNAQNNQVRYEVIARPGAMSVNQGDYAFEVGQELLKEMNDHTAIDFHEVNVNLKMTQAAIPDFSAGAMENWGLLTYREAYLMYDPENTNSNFKQLIAYILSHEIAHMWFGNLVTNDWWDVLWLNEGFARYYQYFLTDWVEDYMGLGTRFITEQVHTALLADSSNNPHSLSTSNIGSPASVSGMFSTLSYNKGAAVIRMTEHLLGFEVHRAGLRNYLKDNQFKTTLPIHLFEALQNAAETSGAITAYGPDFSVIDYYKSWTEQSGHPVLNVQVNHTSGLMTISQRRFNINTGYAITNNNNYIVPINFATASNPDFSNTKPTHIIRSAVTTIPRGSVGDEWVIFNKQQTGYYRVNYDDYTWDLITMQLRGANMTQIHEFNRAQIVDDVFQFARSGLMTYTRAFNILSYLENEKAYTPWVAAINGFNWLRNRLAGSSALTQLEALIIKWSANVIQDLGYNPPPANEAFMTTYLRFQLAPVLCAINAPNCNEAANTQFRALVNQATPVHVDSRNWVYCNALRGGTAADFNFLWQRYQTHNVYTEKILLLQVLGCTTDSTSLQTFLNAIVSENYVVRPQDYTTAFGNAVNSNEGNTQIVFQYIRNNLEAVIAAFGGAVTPLSYISARLRTEAEIVAFETWANETQAALGDDYQAVYNNAGATRNSLAWASAVQSDLNNYFVNGDQPVSYTVSPPTVPPQVVTVTPPPLVEPVTPELESPPSDSTVTNYMSVLIVALAVILNIVV